MFSNCGNGVLSLERNTMLNEEVEMTSQATSSAITRLWKISTNFIMKMTESDVSLHAATSSLSKNIMYLFFKIYQQFPSTPWEISDGLGVLNTFQEVMASSWLLTVISSGLFHFVTRESVCSGLSGRKYRDLGAGGKESSTNFILFCQKRKNIKELENININMVSTLNSHSQANTWESWYLGKHLGIWRAMAPFLYIKNTKDNLFDFPGKMIFQSWIWWNHLHHICDALPQNREQVTYG